MQAAQTSINALQHLEKSGKAASIEARIKGLFSENPSLKLTREEVAERLGIRLATTCGRIKPLLKTGFLAVRGEVVNESTGHKNEQVGLKLESACS